MQAGTAVASTSIVRRQSIAARNAATRLALMRNAAIDIIGTTGSGPTIGTSTSGSSNPVP
jgi:hypothetical protein